MTTTQTDRLMALADRYAFHIPGSQHSDEARAVLLAALQVRDQQGPIKTWQQRLEETCPALGPMHIHACVEEVNDAMQAEIDDLRAALQEQAREGEAVAWHHGCNVLCTNIDLWVDRCPHCGKPRPAAPAPQPAQPSDIGIPITQPEQGERSASKAELLKNLTQWLDGLGGAIHTYSLRGIALHGFEKGWDAALQSAQPVAQPCKIMVIDNAHPNGIDYDDWVKPVALPLTPEELDLCRQWFDSIQDTNAEYLEPSDYLLAEKLYKQLNMRVPHSISEITKSGIGGAL